MQSAGSETACIPCCLLLFLAGTLATAVLSDPFLDEQPGGLRELQEALEDELMDDAADALKQASKAADKVMNVATTKVGNAPWHLQQDSATQIA
jgi:hypothetical protein